MDHLNKWRSQWHNYLVFCTLALQHDFISCDVHGKDIQLKPIFVLFRGEYRVGRRNGTLNLILSPKMRKVFSWKRRKNVSLSLSIFLHKRTYDIQRHDIRWNSLARMYQGRYHSSVCFQNLFLSIKNFYFLLMPFLLSL